MSLDYLWGLAGTGLVMGALLIAFAGPLSRWNRRHSLAPGQESPSSLFIYSARYMRILGWVCLVAGAVFLIIGLTRL
ncbi:hypothetical protein J2S58_002113 [Nakamurella flavida]|uniref:hypothetical protein n=1 Tax=Nakamurella flavida TaxID=363630 RepID=UPI002780DD11|nr:hypothetical protein [Nakamurella flavida]MDP9778490.1 hypothetical protein [Nakamurella flavida]